MRKKGGIHMRTMLLLTSMLACAVASQADLGTRQFPSQVAERDLNQVIITETGQITMSVDGLGTSNFFGGLVQVEKPSAAATVRAAYLATASTGFSGIALADGDVMLNGQPVAWSLVSPNGISCYNHWADVTSIVAPTLNMAAAGITDLPLVEVNAWAVDGSALYVIFDDPATTITRTAVIAFGAQATTGDQFAVGFGQPVDVEPTTVIEMGLAISFSAQGQYSCQNSQIDVNGIRLTSDAGHTDDGEFADGALLTVGGIGDNRANPADPYDGTYYCPGGYLVGTDDELYNIASFVNDGDTGVLVHTVNPSGDDNIFAAHLLLDFAAVVNEGAVLNPAQAVNCLCEPHTVTMTVQNDTGAPLINTPAAIWVQTGPGAPAFIQGLTDGNGQLQLTYTSCEEGMDIIVGNFLNSQGEWEMGNRAFKYWVRCNVDANEQPAAFALAQNTPNPFNPTTSIAFTLAETGPARLTLHDLSGRLVATLAEGVLERGEHQISVDGSQLASGVYLYTLQAGNATASRKMVLMK